MITTEFFASSRDALRSRALRQSLYDEGSRLMGPVIVNLHGQAHTDRRRLENRLFSPETVAWYEAERTPAIIADVLAPALELGHGDVLPLARRVMLWLSLDVAGVDLPAGEPRHESFERLFSIMHRLAQASVVVHSTGDKGSLIADGDAALQEFEQQFYVPSLARRQALINAGAALPRDVLTTLLVNEDRLQLPDEDVLREVAYFPWVGAHSTAAQLVHALHHQFAWLRDHPEDRGRLIADDQWRQRFVHESMRLHPASPVAQRIAVEPVEIAGNAVAVGDRVTIDIESANRDAQVFGADPDVFNPDRTVIAGAPRWGLSFGSGMHACVGRELAGGQGESTAGSGVLGAVSQMTHFLLSCGAEPIPDDPPTLDAGTTRDQWGRYPVCFR